MRWDADYLITEAFLRFIGIVALCSVGVIVAMLALGAMKRPRMGDLQLSADPDKVKQVVQQPAAVSRLRRQLLADYVFITFYWLTFIGLSIATARRHGAWYEAVGVLAAFTASLTAVLDVIENVRT